MNFNSKKVMEDTKKKTSYSYFLSNGYVSKKAFWFRRNTCSLKNKEREGEREKKRKEKKEKAN